jgi:hypothetical protein
MKAEKLDGNIWKYGQYYIVKEIERTFKGVKSARHIIYTDQKRLTSRDSLKKAIQYIDEL